MMRVRGAIGKVLCAAIAFCAIAVLVWCSAGSSQVAESYSLNKDDSLRTEWGAVAQYKVDESWVEEIYENDSFESAYYSSDEGDLYISVYVANTRDDSYYGNTSATYADWLDEQEMWYSGSGDSAEFTNYSMDEMGTIEVDGLEFRLYKQTFTITYSDESYANYLSEKPDLEQTTTYVYYIAVIKDGSHDMEIVASDERLLRDFVDTMQISW